MIQKNKRKKIALLLATLSLFIIIIILLIDKYGTYSNRIVATVNSERIYENEVKLELLDIFPSAYGSNFEIARLPKNVLEEVSKAIYIKRKIYQEAKKKMIHKDSKIKDDIDKYSKKLISSRFISIKSKNNINKKALRLKYLELSDDLEEKRRYKISHILVKTKYQAQKIKSKISKNNSFEDVVIKYSLDRKTRSRNGNLGYFLFNNLQKEFQDIVENMNKGDISDPVKTNKGWHIIKLNEIKDLEVKNFNNMRYDIIEEMKQENILNIFLELSKNAKVEILIR